MNKIIPVITTLCAIGLCLALFGTLRPWYAETFGEKEEKEKITFNLEDDVKSCYPYTPYRGKDNVLMCQCTNSEKQKPGKCNEKYK